MTSYPRLENTFLIIKILFVELASLNSTFFSKNNLSKTAIVYQNQQSTYLDFQNHVNESIQQLKNLGVKQGDLLVCWSENHPRVLVQLLACEVLNLKFMPVSLKTPRAEIDRLVAHFPKVFIQKSGLLIDELQNSPEITFKTLTGLVLRSSGSTGPSKVLIHSFVSVLQNAHLAADFQKLGDNSKVLVSLSMSHTGGLNMQTLPCLARGGSVILGEASNRNFLLSSQTQNPTHLVLVPSQIRCFLTDEIFRKNLSPSLKSVLTGSTPVVQNDWQLLEPVFDNITSVYGVSECGPFVFVTNELKEPHPKTLSYLGKSIAPYEYTLKEGEIGLKGPCRAETLDDDNSDFWFTGDLAKETAEGLYFIGRKRRTLSVAGHKFAPEEVENLLIDLSTVEDCVLIGKPHPTWGQIPIALIKGDQKNEKEIRDFCKKNIAHYKCPKKFVFLKNFPRTEIEKIDYFQLGSFL